LKKYFPALHLPNQLFRFPGLAGWLLFWGICPVSAQIQIDTNTLHHESLRQGINTFSAGTGIDHRHSFARSQRLELQAGQYWIYNRALPSRNFITHNLWSLAQYRRSWSPRWNWTTEAWQFSYLANETRIAQVLTHLRYHWIRTRNQELFVQVGGGMANDKRLKQDNSGIKGEVLAEWLYHSADSTLNARIIGVASDSRINPRNNQRFLGTGRVGKDFSGGGLLALEAGWLQNKVEDYLGQDIQSIQSDTLFARAKIRIPITSALMISSENDFQTPNRSFFYRSKDLGTETRNVRYFQDEIQSLNEIRYRRKKLSLLGSFESRLRNRTYDILNRLDPKSPDYNLNFNIFNQKLKDERIKDIREMFRTWTADFRYQPHKRHAFRLNYVAQLLRVDTRSELNNQDRDEILYAGELMYDWQLVSGLRLTNRFSGSLRHLIFIEASQSNENYIDRILRWEPAIRWNNKFFNWTGQMGIWATYQVRDFASQQDKNRSNRVLIFNHQADVRLHARWRIFTEALRRENRLSQLNWKDFSESPIDTVVLYDLALRAQWASTSDSRKPWSVQMGYRAFWQVRKSKASLSDPATGVGLIYLQSYFVQQGPQIKFRYEALERIRFQGEVWLQWSSQFFRYEKGEGTFLGNTFSQEQLSVRDQRFLPFFNLQGTWLIGRLGRKR
jgi:hypothetical protein